MLPGLTWCSWRTGCAAAGRKTGLWLSDRIDPDTGEYFVSPIKNPKQVDQRRAEVGLGPLQEYISNWGLTWDVEAYKQKLPELEANQAR